MIKVSFFFPHRDGAKFNIKYYLSQHVPMLKERLGSALKNVVIDRGLRGGTPKSPPHFILVANLMFDDLPSFRAAFRPNAQEFLKDVPNFTNVRPRIQISQVLKA
jgi:uncharacterized protein (TIGR02118 family)